MSTLVEFLTARWDEAEAIARAAVDALADDGSTCSWPDYQTYCSDDLTRAYEHLNRFRPTHQLADIAAKRKILELHTSSHECSVLYRGVLNGEPYVEADNCHWCQDTEDCSTVRLLAAPFHDHPDYREEWAP